MCYLRDLHDDAVGVHSILLDGLELEPERVVRSKFVSGIALELSFGSRLTWVSLLQTCVSLTMIS